MPASVDRDPPDSRQLSRAMLLAGLATFALLYGVQPLLPVFAKVFSVDAEEASLALSLSTGAMALCLIPAGILSDRIGRRPLMIVSLLASAGFALGAAVAPGWGSLLVCRLLAGIALAGIPAVAMTYLAEELDAEALGRAMGLYIAGNAIGGMLGRLGGSLVADWLGWRAAMAAVGLFGLIAALGFWRSAPPSRRFVARADDPAAILAGFARLARDAALPWLFAQGFLIMGAFVTLYNYAGFLLGGAPFHLSQSAIGAIFLLYVLGSASSTWFGGFAGRAGRRKVLWLPIGLALAGALLTAIPAIIAIVAGLAAVTIGFFGAHSIVSSWVGRRARGDKALASATYLSSYYLGASVLGSLGGICWTRGGWGGVIAFVAALQVLALASAFRLATVRPLPLPEAAAGALPPV